MEPKTLETIKEAFDHTLKLMRYYQGEEIMINGIRKITSNYKTFRMK